MKRGMHFIIWLLFASATVWGQKSFTGVVKYKMTVIGASDGRTDSMKVIFGNNKIKTIFYLPATNGKNTFVTKSYIDNFSDNTTTDIDDQAGTYTISSLNRDQRYRFVNSNKFDAVENKLCFIYNADKADYDVSKYKNIYCLASIDYLYRGILNYSFYNIQPIIVDNRLVFDFSTVEKDGNISKIVMYDISESNNVEQFFSLQGLHVKQ